MVKKIKCFFCDEKDREDYMATYKRKPMCATCRDYMSNEERDLIIKASHNSQKQKS